MQAGGKRTPIARVIRPRGGVYLLGLPPGSAARVFQSLVESVQLVAEVTKSDLFHSQLLLGLYFSRLRLLILVF